jgi:hypothetical protein
MQKHPSSLAVLVEIFFVIGGNFSNGSHWEKDQRKAEKIKMDLPNTSWRA